MALYPCDVLRESRERQRLDDRRSSGSWHHPQRRQVTTHGPGGSPRQSATTGWTSNRRRQGLTASSSSSSDSSSSTSEYLLAVNGRELRAGDNIHGFFEATAGKNVVLRVGPNPNETGSREVTVNPIATDARPWGGLVGRAGAPPLMDGAW
jgi:hypothetical protein